MRLTEVSKLQEKKFRKEYGLYVIQGEKSVDEALQAGIVVELFCTEELYGKYKKVHPAVTVASEKAIRDAGTQTTSDGVIALARCSYEPLSPHDIEELTSITKEDTVLVLDGVNDPGNLGTIIRTADWFGVTHIVCSIGTVDRYNPKVISATMGSFLRVSVHYLALKDFFESAKKHNPVVLGATLEGSNVNELECNAPCILVMGSESHGLSDETYAYITKEVTIPKKGGAESLNVAVATAIILSRISS